MLDSSNVSTLLSSLNSSSSSDIDYAQYASIKNGSYGKLAKAYYSKQASSTSSSDSTDSTDSTSTSTSTSTSSVTDSTGLTKMKKVSDSLKESAEALSDSDLWEKKNGSYDTDSIVSAVKSFVSDYNSVVKQTSNVTSSEVTDRADNITSLSGTMSKSLAKIGITVGTDGTLSLDEDALKSADMSDVKEMFSGSYSYGGQVGSLAGNVSSATLMTSSIYNEDGTATSAITSLFNGYV